MKIPISYGIKPVPYQGMPGIDAPRLPGGRQIELDAILTFGKNVGSYLTQVNSHYLSFVFRTLVSRKAPPQQLQIVWDIGQAMMTQERVREGDSSDGLVNYWATLRKGGIDLGADFFVNQAKGRELTEEDFEIIFSFDLDVGEYRPSYPSGESEFD